VFAKTWILGRGVRLSAAHSWRGKHLRLSCAHRVPSSHPSGLIASSPRALRWRQAAFLGFHPCKRTRQSAEGSHSRRRFLRDVRLLGTVGALADTQTGIPALAANSFNSASEGMLCSLQEEPSCDRNIGARASLSFGLCTVSSPTPQPRAGPCSNGGNRWIA
jgi:hypothetical protein